MDSLGTILGFGNTIDAALGLVKERAEMVKGKRLSTNVNDLEKLKKSIADGVACGIDF